MPPSQAEASGTSLVEFNRSVFIVLLRRVSTGVRIANLKRDSVVVQLDKSRCPC